jgi:hypothetical protein
VTALPPPSNPPPNPPSGAEPGPAPGPPSGSWPGHVPGPVVVARRIVAAGYDAIGSRYRDWSSTSPHRAQPAGRAGAPEYLPWSGPEDKGIEPSRGCPQHAFQLC